MKFNMKHKIIIIIIIIMMIIIIIIIVIILINWVWGFQNIWLENFHFGKFFWINFEKFHFTKFFLKVNK